MTPPRHQLSFGALFSSCTMDNLSSIDKSMSRWADKILQSTHYWNLAMSTLPANMQPDHFEWGCATSAFQIEGASREDGRLPSIWDDFCAQPGRIMDGSDGMLACDHYHRYAADI